MITKSYSFTLSGGVAPYDYIFSSNNDSCITYSSPAGVGTLTADGDITENISFSTESCLESAQVTLTVTDANGCKEVQPVTVVNPCTVTLSSVTQQGFTFSALASGGTPNYTYSWTYDDDIFDINDSNPTDNVLFLNYNPSISPVPETTQIAVVVTDTKGCESSTAYSVNLDQPVANPVSAFAHCSTNNSCNTSFYTTLQLSVGNSSSVDWNTLSITGGSNLCYTNLGNGWVNVGTDGTEQTSVALSYTVQNTLGITSNVGTISISLPLCTRPIDDCYFIGSPGVIQILSTDIVTDVKTLGVITRISSSDTIDWTTFQFLNTPSYGTVVLNNNREIEYTITSLAGTTADTIEWSVENDCGKVLTMTDIVNRNVVATPVTAGDTICGQCNTPTAATDVTANDTGTIDKSTIQITSITSDVQYSKDANNDLIFTALPDPSLNRIVQYLVKNTQGVDSNTSNIVLSVTCAGTPLDQNITCWASKIFDLLDYFQDAAAISYTFTETTTGTTYTSQGGTIGAATGTVDFSAINSGTYTFEITAVGAGGCVTVGDDTAEISITLDDAPSLTIDSVVNNGDDTGTVNFTIVGLSSIASLVVLNNTAAVTYTIAPSISGTSGTFTINLVSGNNDVSITALSICNTTLTDNDTIVN